MLINQQEIQYIRSKTGAKLVINNNFIIRACIKKEDGIILDLLRIGLRSIQQSLVLLDPFHSKLLTHGSFHMLILLILFHLTMRNRYIYSTNFINRIVGGLSAVKSFTVFSSRLIFISFRNKMHHLNIGRCNHLQDSLRL